MTPCPHPQLTRATNVTAWIVKGHLQGGDPDAVIRYEEIVYCSRPTCEAVIRSTKA